MKYFMIICCFLWTSIEKESIESKVNTISVNMTRASKIKIAILDTGVDFNHSLLKNFKSPTTIDSDAVDSYGHGTHVTGIVVKQLQETFGSEAKNIFEIRSFKYDPKQNNSYNKALLNALKWYPDVINLSLSGLSKGAFEEKAIKLAIKIGIKVVASAGNDGTNQDSYPCSINGVFCVGNLDENGHISPSSNFGKNVQFYARGMHILSALPQEQFGYYSGTSQSAPIMTAYIASRLVSKDADSFFKKKILYMPPVAFKASYGTTAIHYKDYKLKDMASIADLNNR